MHILGHFMRVTSGSWDGVIVLNNTLGKNAHPWTFHEGYLRELGWSDSTQ